VGIFIDGNGNHVHGNTAFSASIFENITILGNRNRIEENRVFNGGDADIFIQGNNNNVMGNLITEAPVGILVGAGSTGNTFAANTFHGVTTTIQDPPTGNLSKKIVADRP